MTKEEARARKILKSMGLRLKVVVEYQVWNDKAKVSYTTDDLEDALDTATVLMLEDGRMQPNQKEEAL